MVYTTTNDSEDAIPTLLVLWYMFSNKSGGVFQNSGFTTDEQKVLLSAAAVARYSTYYWMRYASNPKTSRLFKDILKWGAYVAGDVTGILATGNFECAGDCSVAMYYLLEYNSY